MQDIENKQDIELLINEFYKKVMADPFIGPFFTKVAHFHGTYISQLWFHFGKQSCWEQ